MDETSRAILALLAEGRTLDEIFAEHPNLTTFDVMAAAAEGLSALEAPREARIRAARERHARVFEPWTEEEDARLLLRWSEGAKLADLGRALQRPPGAIRMRLERHLGAKFRAVRSPDTSS